MAKSIHLEEGQRFNQLTVVKLDHIKHEINPTDKKVRNIEFYLCKCDCGNFKVVEKRGLKKGTTKTCGALKHRHKDNIIILKDNWAEIHIKNKDDEIIKVLIDKEDIYRVQTLKWSLKYDETVKTYYIYAWERNNFKNRKKISLHRFLMNTPKNMECDHINRNPLDNRKNNLRNVTQLENLQNKGFYKNNKSGIKHICWLNRLKVWSCEIKKNKKVIFRFRNKDLKAVIEAKEKFLNEQGGIYGYNESR